MMKKGVQRQLKKKKRLKLESVLVNLKHNSSLSARSNAEVFSNVNINLYSLCH